MNEPSAFGYQEDGTVPQPPVPAGPINPVRLCVVVIFCTALDIAKDVWIGRVDPFLAFIHISPFPLHMPVINFPSDYNELRVNVLLFTNFCPEEY